MLALIHASFSPTSFASSATGKATLILPHVGDQVFFNVENHTKTGCITTDTGRFRIDLSTQTGKAMYSLLLSAQAQGKKLTTGAALHIVSAH